MDILFTIQPQASISEANGYSLLDKGLNNNGNYIDPSGLYLVCKAGDAA